MVDGRTKRGSSNILIVSKSRRIKTVHVKDSGMTTTKEAADQMSSMKKKKMKKLRTMKRISELEDAADFNAFVGNQEYVHHSHNNNNHGKAPTVTPNYMKPTTSSYARKEQQLRSSQKNKPSKLLTRKSSLRVVRPSSTLVKTTASTNTACRYDHCSLNGHAHRHRTTSPIKTFISSRKRLLKTQKTTKLRGISSFIKRTEKHPKPDSNRDTALAGVENEKLTSVDITITEFEYLLISPESYDDGDPHKDSSIDEVVTESPPPVRDEIDSFSDGRNHHHREEDDEEAVREFNPRGPNYLPVEAEPEGETVDLKHQMTDDRKKSEEWMVDYALRRVVGELGPSRNNKVELLVEAFETVTPTDDSSSSSSSSSSIGQNSQAMPVAVKNDFDIKYKLED